jgi:hypothetical protein
MTRQALKSIIDIIPDNEIAELVTYIMTTYSGAIGMALADAGKAMATLEKKKEVIKQQKIEIANLEQKLMEGAGEMGPQDES